MEFSGGLSRGIETGLTFIATLVMATSLSACFGKAENSSLTSAATNASGITVSWDANKETSVNSTGGGYNVTYTPQGASGVTVNVPYAGGAQTPHSTILHNLTAGSYTLSVTAYSALNPSGVTSSPTPFTVGGSP